LSAKGWPGYPLAGVQVTASPTPMLYGDVTGMMFMSTKLTKLYGIRSIVINKPPEYVTHNYPRNAIFVKILTWCIESVDSE
jgi:hypothetical protein